MSTQGISFILELTKRDFTERFAGSVLGSLWAIIWPLVNLSIYIIIFGKMMGGRLPGTSDMHAYGVYLAVGLIPWTCFSSVIARSASVFLDKKHIITKVNTSLPSFLIYINLSETITFLISMGILFVFLISQGYEFHSRLLFLPFLYCLQQFLAMGIGLFVASLTVFMRDFREMTGVVLQLWFWFTPIVYLFDILPGMVKRVVVFNPAFILIESYHKIFVFNTNPSIRSLMILSGISVVIGCFSYFMFRYLEKDIRDFL